MGLFRGKAKSLIFAEATRDSHLQTIVSRKASDRCEDDENHGFWLKRDATLQEVQLNRSYQLNPSGHPRVADPTARCGRPPGTGERLPEIYLTYTTSCAICEEIRGVLALVPRAGV